MSLKKQALSGIFWTFLQQFGSQGITFIVSVVLARLLMPEEFGLIAMISIVISIGNSIINSGLGISLIRTIDPDEKDYSTIFLYNLVGSIIFYLLSFSIAPYIANFYNQDILIDIIRVYCLVFIINSFSTIHTYRLTQKLDFKKQMKVTIPSLIISGVSGILMAYNGFGVWSIVFSTLIQTSLISIQYWVFSGWNPSFNFDKEKFKYHFSFGLKLTISGVIDHIFRNSYTIFIGRYFQASTLGFYNRAETLKQFPVTNIGHILNKVTFPLFSTIQRDDLKMKSVFKKIMKMVVFIVCPILVFMAVLSEPLFRFLFTEKWLPAVPFFQIICLNGILQPIQDYNLNILKVKGKSDLILKIEIIKKILLIIIAIISLYWGIYGLLWGSVIHSLISFLINAHYSGSLINYNVKEQFIDLFPYPLLAMLSGFIIYYLDYFFVMFNYHDFWRLLINSIVGVVLYLFMCYLLKFEAVLEVIKLLKVKKKYSIE